MSRRDRIGRVSIFRIDVVVHFLTYEDQGFGRNNCACEFLFPLHLHLHLRLRNRWLCFMRSALKILDTPFRALIESDVFELY